MKSSKRRGLVAIVCPKHGLVGYVEYTETVQTAPAAHTGKSSSAHLAADPKFGEGHEAIFGKKHRRRITREEAELN